jgi:WbqC-like protein family
MQPYFFPYIGYYQLLHAAQTFVFFDDVNYINKGWISRNNMLQKNKSLLFTVPLLKASQNRLINEIELLEFDKWKNGFLKQVHHNYCKAPFYSFVFKWLNEFFNSQNYTHIGQLAMASISEVVNLLELDLKLMKSSEINYNRESSSSGQDKILSICSVLKADHYINAINGRELYNPNDFVEKNIRLSFIQMQDIIYPQWNNTPFVPYLSILDVLMFNGIEKTKQFLQSYSLN